MNTPAPEALSNAPFLLRGDGDHACLMLHGLGGGIYEHGPLARRLHARGLTVHGFNYPGHDAPADRMPASRWEDWYARALEGYRALAADHARVSVVGFSTGCQLALLIASEHPVASLALLSPYVRIRHRWYYGARPEAYVRALGGLVRDVPRRALSIADPAMRAAAADVAYYRTFSVAAVRSAMELIARVRPRLPAIHTPTLVLQSLADSVVDPDGAEDLQREMGAAPEVVWLRRSDHVIGLDVEREVVFARVGAFLAAAGARGTGG